MTTTSVLAALAQSPVKEILAVIVGALLALAVERVRHRLSRHATLTAEAAKVRLAAYGRVLGAVSPVAAVTVLAAVAESMEEDADLSADLVKRFDAAHEAAWNATMDDYLLIGTETSLAIFGFLGFTDNTFEILKSTQRGDPQRAERFSNVASMIASVEKALPRFAQLPGERHFRQQDLSDVYTTLGVWPNKRASTDPRA